MALPRSCGPLASFHYGVGEKDGRGGLMARGRRYSEEFKQEAVRLYKESESGYRKVAADLGVSAFALRQWVQQAGAVKGLRVISESEELRRLKRENRILREERDILRKAVAFFARDELKTR